MIQGEWERVNRGTAGGADHQDLDWSRGNVTPLAEIVQVRNSKKCRGLEIEIFVSKTLALVGQGKPPGRRLMSVCSEYSIRPPGGFSAAGSMTAARAYHTATSLKNDKVLVAGGGEGDSSGNFITESWAELYDAVSGTFSSTGSMTTARFAHTATPLPNGNVLIGGGSGQLSANAIVSSLDSAEIFNPANGTFTATGKMTSPRAYHTATLLVDGTVLVVGGDPYNYLLGITGSANGTPNPIGSAETFDPNSGTFTQTGGLLQTREVHTTTSLNDGTVLVTGGLVVCCTALATAETYQ